MSTRAARPLLRLAAEGGGGTLFSDQDEAGQTMFWFAGTQMDWDDERDEDVWTDWKTTANSELSAALPTWWFRTRPIALDGDTAFRAALRQAYETATSLAGSEATPSWSEWIATIESEPLDSPPGTRARDYHAAVRSHLGRYKTATLGIEECGVWSGNGKSYPHILPDSMYAHNILAPIRAEVLEYIEQRGISRHRDFHHLNSSQALCFNLFFPFFVGPQCDPTALLHALRLPTRRVLDASFEHVENVSEGTNFDFFATFEPDMSSPRPRLYVEVKFTERRFGTCENDDAHRSKLEQDYRPMLDGKVDAAALDADLFFAHYQFWRNVAHADQAQDATVLFLVPRGNTGLLREWKTVSAHLTDAVRPAVHHAFLEDVLEDLLLATPHLNARLAAYVPQLAAKYAVA